MNMSQNHLPEQVQQNLLQDTTIQVSGWVKEAINSATRIDVHFDEKNLASKLIQQAYNSANKKEISIGIALAAAFDLFVAADYYKSIANRGWYYCPVGDPLLFYPYTNTCPRCILRGSFHFEEANKPGSGSIGQTTSRILGVFLLELFARAGKNLQVYKGVEPIDMIIFDESTKTVLLSEIKAAPLQTLALAVSSDSLTEVQENGEISFITTHVATDNTSLSSSEIHMCLPIMRKGLISYKLVSLSSANRISSDSAWAYRRIEQALDKDTLLFDEFLEFWVEAFKTYKPGNSQRSNIYWLTNACGQPNPRPSDWPARRRGTGYESVSDGKTSVGMDRTDDIKKGIYQVLKVGAESKPQQKRNHFTVKTALISNIHAARHYEEYLASLENIVWALDESGQARKAADLPPETEVYNLFDGIISFTKSHIRDKWLEQIFNF
jgi:hypothetical protein